MGFDAVGFGGTFDGMSVDVALDELAHVVGVFGIVDVVEICRVEHIDGALFPAIP